MDPNTAGEGGKPQDPKDGEARAQDPEQDPKPQEGGEGEAKTQDPKQPEGTVNRHQYERDIQRRDQEIAELRKQLEEGGKAKKSTDERLAELEQRMAERERELADERANSKLSAAGCIDLDLGRAALGRFDGDVARLKEAKPYLFSEGDRTQRSTGGRPAGQADPSAEQVERARKAAGTARYYDRPKK